MIRTYPTKNGTGITIYGLSDDLKYLYDVVHYIATTLDESHELLKGRQMLLMNFAYELRKAYQGQRLSKGFIQEFGDDITYCGFNIVWTDLFIFQNVLRQQAGYLMTNKRMQSVLFGLEAGIEDAIHSYDSEFADELINYIGFYFSVTTKYCFLIYQALHIHFVLEPGGKKRFRKLPKLLGEYFSEFNEEHKSMLQRFERLAKEQGCEITDLTYSEFPDIKW